MLIRVLETLGISFLQWSHRALEKGLDVIFCSLENYKIVFEKSVARPPSTSILAETILWFS